MVSSRLLQRQICRVIGVFGLSGCLLLTGCGQGAGKALIPGPGGTKNGSVTGGSGNSSVAPGSGVAAGNAAGGHAANGKPATGQTTTISAFGGGSFDPQGLFNLYSDTLYVTETGSTVYVSWESFSNGDMVYTSIAQNGVWTVTDKPVYSLSTMSSDGDWSALFSGNRLIVVDRFRNDSYLIEWNASGTVTSQQQLYKGWVGGAFGVRVGGQLGVALHLPYGAPSGGAKYNLYIPGSGSKSASVTVGQAQFTGALYALNPKTNLLYEAKHVQGTGNPVIDVYQYGVQGVVQSPTANTQTSSGSSVSDVPINTVPLTTAGGSLVQTTVQRIPDELAISPSGDLFTFSMTPNQHGMGSAAEFDANLNEIKTWPSIHFSNPYLESASITVSTGTPHIWAVYSIGGKAGLQEIVLK